MKKTIKCVILILTVALVICYDLIFLPVKKAIYEEELSKSEKPYYLIQWVQVTGASWMIIGDQTGIYKYPKYIIAEGNIPSIINNYDIATGDNTYICYGEYYGKFEIGGGVVYDKYYFSEWDILYPVKRNNPIPFMPREYLCKLDFKWSQLK